MLLPLFIDGLNGCPSSFLIMADAIEELNSGKPEWAIYYRRLKDLDTLRLQTAIDAVLKFGEAKERKLLARAVRVALKCRKDILRHHVISFPSLSRRKSINKIVGNICPEGIRLRYSCTPKRSILHNRRLLTGDKITSYWFINQLKAILNSSVRPG